MKKSIKSQPCPVNKKVISEQSCLTSQNSELRRGSLGVYRLNAAGIDIGSRSHFVAIPEGRSNHKVREFSSFTSDLKEMARWLRENSIETVAMESTGVFWIPVYEILEQNGIEAVLVNASQAKNVPGRPKSDMLDCQWIQRLHETGMIRGAFRPKDDFVVLRSYIRLRSDLIAQRSEHSLRMQKALSLMNVHLANVISDITGLSGMQIIRAILAGERDPVLLAQLANSRCANSKDVISKSLEGNYRQEHIFFLKQSVDLYDYYGQKILECEQEIQRVLSEMYKTHQESTDAPAKENDIPKSTKKRKKNKNNYQFDVHNELLKITKVDLTKIPGIDASTAMKIVSEIGVDMSCWPSVKHFSSWLGLCPGTKISGGHRISGATKPCANKAAGALQMSANGLYNSETFLGAFLRRKKNQKGPAKAVTATAHKIAKSIYYMLKDGKEYKELGSNYYEEAYQERMIRNLKKKAAGLGFDLTPKTKAA
jgi:transposase